MDSNSEAQAKKYFQRRRSGTREKCYQEAQRLGYEEREKTEERILMQYRNKNYWATITETGDSQRPWELVLYRTKPTCQDPRPKEDFLKRAKRIKRR